MASPDRYFDPDPPPRGSCRLTGDHRTLDVGRKTSEFRPRGTPSAPDVPPMLLRNLMIAHAVLEMGFSHEAVGDAMGLSRVRVTNIILELEARHNKQYPAD